MKRVSLEIFCRDRTQSEVAAMLGYSQGAISQMIAARRAVVIEINDDLSITALLLWPLPPDF